MTEYDYSPGAYERYMENQARVAKWVDNTNYHAAEFQDAISPPPPPTPDPNNDHSSYRPSHRHLEVRPIPHRRSSSVGSPSHYLHQSILAAPAPLAKPSHMPMYVVQPTQARLPVPSAAPMAYQPMTRPPSPRYSLYPPSQKPSLLSRRSQSHEPSEPRYKLLIPGSSGHHSHSRRRSPSRSRHHTRTATVMVNVPVQYASPQRQPISAPAMMISPPLSTISPPLTQYPVVSTNPSQMGSYGTGAPGYFQYQFISPYQQPAPAKSVYPGPYGHYPHYPVHAVPNGVQPMAAYPSPPITASHSHGSPYGPSL